VRAEICEKGGIMPRTRKTRSVIATEKIESKIYQLRGKRVMLDKDLAILYGVTTGNLNKAVKRNVERFPEDFMFQLNRKEWISLSFQFGSLKRGQHPKYLPYVFTEQGVAMLSSVLRSKKAIMVNIQIMRVFVSLKRVALTYIGLKRKIEAMEQKYDGQFKIVFTAIKRLLEGPPVTRKRRIGFRPE